MTTIENTNIQIINEKHSIASNNADLSKSHACAAIIAAWECGRLLSAEKTKVEHGEWLQWLEINCPNITARTAQRYMDHGRKYDSVSHLVDSMNAKALIAIGLLPEPDPTSGGNDGMSKPDRGLAHIQHACQWFNQPKNDPTKLNDVAQKVYCDFLKPLVELYKRLGGVV